MPVVNPYARANRPVKTRAETARQVGVHLFREIIVPKHKCNRLYKQVRFRLVRHERPWVTFERKMLREPGFAENRTMIRNQQHDVPVADGVYRNRAVDFKLSDKRYKIRTTHGQCSFLRNTAGDYYVGERVDWVPAHGRRMRVVNVYVISADDVAEAAQRVQYGFGHLPDTDYRVY